MRCQNRSEWNVARVADWEAVKPLNQELTKELSCQGAKLYSIYVGEIEQGKMYAKVKTWTVTSIDRFHELSILKGVRLNIVQDGTGGEITDSINCINQGGRETFDLKYFDTVESALSFALAETKHVLEWIKVKPHTVNISDIRIDKILFDNNKKSRELIALHHLKKSLSR